MPRPPLKRKKLNHPSPARRVAKGPNVPTISAQQVQQTLAHKSIGRGLSDSDDSDRLIISNRSGRNRRGVARVEVFASGAVAPGDTTGAHRSQSQTRRSASQPVAPKFGVQAGNGAVAAALAQKQQNGIKRTGEKMDGPVPIPTTSNLPSSSVPKRAPSRLQDAPAADVSMLGTIKPRRRQQSILQLIENNDSSNIADEDEDGFLPNDESTPIRQSKTPGPTSTPLSSLSHPSASRKRKLSAPITLVPSSQEPAARPRSTISATAEDVNVPSTEPELLSPSKPAASSRLTAQSEDADIMAPPESSSPPASPARSRTSSPAKPVSKKANQKSTAPSTSALRALMPTRRQRKGKQRIQPRDEFDIPADSNGDVSHEEHETSDAKDLSFQANTRGQKRRGITKGKGRVTGKPNNNTRVASNAQRTKSTISPIKAITPLKRPSAKKSAAKSSSLQQQHQQQPVLATASTKPKTTYASSRRRGDTIGDKENRPVDSSDSFSLPGSLGGGKDDEEEVGESPKKTWAGGELEQIAKKFADLDRWEMEFEEVSIGISSSPNRR